MAKKPFEIQGSTLRIGGVDLDAGSTSIVIPGVTQATNYFVDEADETGDQTYSNFPANTEITVIDAALYNAIVGELDDSHFADFITTTDDDGEIDEIEVGGSGTYTAAEADRASLNDMYAYTATNSGNTFTQADLSDPSRFYFVASAGIYSLVSFQDAWTNSADHSLLLGQSVGTVFTVIMDSNPTVTYTFISTSSNGIGFDGTWFPQPPSTTMETPSSITFGVKSSSDRPLVPEDWIQIPFRPKMRAGEVENVGGGGTQLPSQSGQEGKFLRTDGEELSWVSVLGGSNDGQVDIVGTKFRVLAEVPTTSTGKAGDLPGQVAFDGTYIYYCTGTFPTTYDVTLYGGYAAGVYPSIPKGDYPQPQAGWTFVWNTVTYTVVAATDPNAGQWQLEVDQTIDTQSGGTITFITSTPGNIWKRVAWSGDTW